MTNYVTPMAGDKVFNGPAICISGLGHATVHFDRFLPKGNGGDSATILTPRSSMTGEEMFYYAALFNILHRWRFSFGRKASRRRIQSLVLSPLFAKSKVDVDGHLSEYSSTMRSQMGAYQEKFLSTDE